MKPAGVVDDKWRVKYGDGRAAIRVVMRMLRMVTTSVDALENALFTGRPHTIHTGGVLWIYLDLGRHMFSSQHKALPR